MTKNNETYDVIILLGYKLYDDGTPDYSTIARAKKAAELWKQGVAPIIVSSGGGPETVPRKQADVMADILIEEGVPDEAIVREDQSRTTIQNIKNTKILLGKESFKAAVVTTDFHVARSVLICKQLGIDATGFGATVPHDKDWRANRRLEVAYILELKMGWHIKRTMPEWMRSIRRKVLAQDRQRAVAHFAEYNKIKEKNNKNE